MTVTKIITKPYEYANMIRELSTAKILGVDTETTGLDPYTYHPLLISIYDGKTAYVVDLLSIDKARVKDLKGILESHDILKVGHNLLFEWKFFYHVARIDMQHMHDVMIADKMLKAGLKLRHGLKEVAARRLGLELDKSIRKSFIGAEPSEISWSQEQLEYSAMDAVYPIDIYPMQMEEIKAQKLEQVYTLEMNIIAPTAMMEYTG